MAEVIDHFTEMTHELFDYNRENFFFDQEQGIEREYQEQDMRVKQFVLYREDIRDLVELTTGKMDVYLLPIVFELGICFLMLVHGELDGPDEDRTGPPWLFWLYTVSLAEAMLYLFLAAWLCMHASVCAHSFGVRLLTQFVRLPVPNKAQLDAARRFAAEFEGSKMLRIPVVRQQASKFEDHARTRREEAEEALSQSARGDEDGFLDITPCDGPMKPMSCGLDSSPNVLLLEHIRLYRKLQANWQAHDAYCRACIALGTYTMVHAISYFIIGYFVVELDNPGISLTLSIILVALAWILVKLDLYFKTLIFVVSAFLLMSGPILTVVSITLMRSTWPDAITHVRYYLVPAVFALQALLIGAIVVVSRAEQVNATGGVSVALPTRFRTVLYLDVFGWLADPLAEDDASGDGNGRSAASACVKSMPPAAWQKLKEDCHRNYNEIRDLLGAWETQDPTCLSKIRENADYVRAIEGFRDRFDGILPDFQRFTSQNDNFSSAHADKDIWLRFSWNDLTYYVNSTSGASAGHEHLPSGSVISDLRELDFRLDDFSSQVWVLKTSDPRVTPAAGEERQRSRAGSSGMMDPMRIPSTFSAGSASSRASGPSGTDARSSMPSRSPMISPATSRTSFSRNITPVGAAPSPGRYGSMPVPGSQASLANVASQCTSVTASSGSSNPYRSNTFSVGASSRGAATFAPTSTRGTGSSRPARNSMSDSLLVHDEASRAQETRFGGREALHTEGDHAVLVDTGGAAAQTFFPRQDTRRESSTPPGQMPWVTFCGASIILVLVWSLGFLFYLTQPIYEDYIHDGGDDGGHKMLLAREVGAPVLTGGQLVFSSDQWRPRPTPIKLVGLACNSGLPGHVLAVEQFGLHRLPIETTSIAADNSAYTQVSPRHQSERLAAADTCLRARPTFQAAGLKSSSLDCTSAGKCNMLLLGKSGMEVLECPLEEQHHRLQPDLISLGRSRGPSAWNSIAINSRNKSLKSDASWWGLPDEHRAAPIKFEVIRSRRSGPHLAVPVAGANLFDSRQNKSWLDDFFAMDHKASRGSSRYHYRPSAPKVHVRQLQAVKDAALLGLSSTGRAIHAWDVGSQNSYTSAPVQSQIQPRTAPRIGTWRVPSDLEAEAICVTDSSIFVAAKADEHSRGPDVWRFDLPLEVADIDSQIDSQVRAASDASTRIDH